MSSAKITEYSICRLITVAFLVAGNVLGVGILALPVKVGLSGFLPSLLDITIICLLMLISAFVIAERLPVDKKHFDIPSFFQQELGSTGRWIAVICNLILLYGILVAYLSGISSIITALFPFHVSSSLVTIIYFLIATSLVIFGRNLLRRGNTVLLVATLICFVVLVKSGTADFNSHLLTYTDWKFLPIGLPVVVSAFHFHNIIPTVSKYVDHNKKKLRIVITIGVAIGLVLNFIWVTVVLGTLPEYGANSIAMTFAHSLPATVPMTKLLHSKIFELAGIIFATLAVTASYVANGTGLFGFIKDLSFSYLKSENKLLIGLLTFMPPLLITIIYPNIFLSAIDIVGGIGETILFAILPGIILVRITRKRSKALMNLGYVVTIIGFFILLYITAQKLGFIHLPIQ